MSSGAAGIHVCPVHPHVVSVVVLLKNLEPSNRPVSLRLYIDMGKGALLCYFAAAILVAHGVPWALSRHLKSVQSKRRDSAHK